MKTIMYVALMALTACSASQSSSGAKGGSAEPAQSGSGEIIELQGSFRSVKGVMHPLSCYCYNSGVLTVSEDKKVSICFPDDNTNTCDNMKVKGYYVVKKYNSGNTDPCPDGEMEIFMVTESACQ